MKSIFRRLTGKSTRSQSAATAADKPSGVELENLEPRMLFSAAPVEAPAETVESGEGQAAEESIAAETPAQQVGDSTGSAQEEAAPAVSGESEVAPEQGVNLVSLDNASASLNQETLDAIAESARQRWIDSGISAEQAASLSNISYRIADLGGNTLGAANGSSITIDDNAGGTGTWFIDATPGQDEEYSSSLEAIAGGAAAGRVDLLTILLHEQGHFLGLDDTPGAGNLDVMDSIIGSGMRRLPSVGQAADADPGSIDGAHFASFMGMTRMVGSGQTYATIQAAVNASGAGDIIQINAGTYNESVNISAGAGSLKFLGVGTVVIEGTSAGPAFYNGSVETADFTFENLEIHNDGGHDNEDGIRLDGVTGTVQILNNTFTNTDESHIFIIGNGSSSTTVLISGNTASNGSIQSSGFIDLASNGTSTINATIVDNNATGTQTIIQLDSDDTSTMNVVIQNNILAGLSSPTTITAAVAAAGDEPTVSLTVVGNTISSADGDGLSIRMAAESAAVVDAVIQGNTFSNIGSGSEDDAIYLYSGSSRGGTVNARIAGNTFGTTGDLYASAVRVRGQTGIATFNVVVQDNDFDKADTSGAGAAVEVDSYGATVNIDSHGNTVAAGFARTGFNLVNSRGGSVTVVDYNGNGSTGNTAEGEIEDNNTYAGGGTEYTQTAPILYTAGANPGFAAIIPVLLGGSVWDDTGAGGGTAGDGIRNGTEPGVASVQANRSGTPAGTTFTNANGDYYFAVAPGNYTVTVIPPDGRTFSPKDQGGNDNTDSDVNPGTGATSSLTVVANTNKLDVDAGLFNAPPSAPEITVRFDDNGTEIIDGDTSPSGTGSEGTDFGQTATAGGIVTRTFRITNDGTATLNLSQPTLTTDTQFSVSTIMGGDLTLDPLETRTFTVTFDPSTDGVKNDTVNIASNDGNEAAYDFQITGEGVTTTAPEITVSDQTGGGANVESGNLIAIGSVANGSTTTRTIRIHNTGDADLNVSGVSISNTMGTAFSLSPDPDPINGTGVIPAAGFADLTVALDTAAAGMFAATVTIANDDTDEGTFTVDFTGTVAAAPTGPNSASVDGSGNLEINADGDGDTVTLSSDGTTLKIESGDNSIVGGNGTTNSNGDVLVTIAGLTSITIDAGGDDDTININSLTGFTGSLDIMGGDGQDLISFAATVTLGLDNDASLSAEEVYLNHAGIETTGAGSINIDATGSSGGTSKGVNLAASNLTAGGTGSISLNGAGGDSGANNQGVQLSGGSTVSTNDGDIDIDGSSSGSASANQGISLLTGSSISAGGSGNLTLDGTGSSSGTSSNHGVSLAAGTSASVENGNMIITGAGAGSGGISHGVNLLGSLTGIGTGNISVTGSSTGTGNNNLGVYGSNASIDTSTGSGSVTLRGTGSTGGFNSNYGVGLANFDIMTGGDGGIDIDGLGGGTGAGTTNNGVSIETGSELSVAGTGSMTIDGTGGSGTNNNRGVYVVGAGSSLTSDDGNVEIRGTANGTAGFNHGMEIKNTALSSTGTGSVTLEGTGSASAGAASNLGIYLLSNTISAVSGDMTLTGIGGTGTNYNEGVRVQSTSVTTGGTLAITGTTQAGTTGSNNSGIYLSGATLNGGAASMIDGSGGGGSTGNHGITNVGVLSSNLAGSQFAGHSGTGGTSTDLYGTFPV